MGGSAAAAALPDRWLLLTILTTSSDGLSRNARALPAVTEPARRLWPHPLRARLHPPGDLRRRAVLLAAGGRLADRIGVRPTFSVGSPSARPASSPPRLRPASPSFSAAWSWPAIGWSSPSRRSASTWWGLLLPAPRPAAAARLALGRGASDRWLVGRGRRGLSSSPGVACWAPATAGALAFATGVGAYGWVGVFFVISAEAGGPRQAGLLSGVAYASIVVGLLVGPPAFGPPRELGLVRGGVDGIRRAVGAGDDHHARRGPHDQPGGIGLAESVGTWWSGGGRVAID